MKLTHVNHSSILCEACSEILVTDPWFLSNAFGGWYQYPAPKAKVINRIYPSKNVSIVLLSHAHDDHVDDKYISKLDDRSIVVIPKTGNSGFKNRILKLGVSHERIYEVNQESIQLGAFTISSIFDGNLSEEDFIFLIGSGNYLFIHANDNWKSFSQQTLIFINEFVKNNSIDHILMMSQIGIADSFPIFYEGISSQDKRSIICKKINYMCKSMISNCEKLGIEKGFSYANQSRFLSLFNDLDFDPYILKDDIINNYHGIYQLYPGDEIINGQLEKNNNNLNTFLNCRLNSMSTAFFDYCQTKKIHLLPVDFCSSDSPLEENKKDRILISASPIYWNEILSGSLNLESILTGGLGIISKPKSYNMKEEYMLLVKWAYKFQIIAKQS